MKILFRLCFFVLLPIIVIIGLSLILTGNDSKGLVLAIGIPCIFAGYFIVWFFSPNNKSQAKSDDEHSENDQAAINHGNASEAIHSVSDNSLEDEKAPINVVDVSQSTSRKAAFCILTFILMVADAIAATALFIKRIFVGGIVCAVLFGVLLISAIVIVAIREKIYMNHDVSFAKKIVGGKVKSCILSDSKKKNAISPMGVEDAVYKVVIAAEDGNEYKAESKRNYDTEESVFIAVMNKQRGIIVDESEVGKIKLDGRDKLKQGIKSRHNYARQHHTHHRH